VSRIVHLGLGSFHRAHQAVYTQDANSAAHHEWRITAVSFRNRNLVQAMRAQHGRYTVLEVGPDAVPPREITVIDKVLLAADEPEQVVDAIADPDTTAVTLTVTEKGYVCRPGSHDLDTTDPAIRRDATSQSRPPAPSASWQPACCAGSTTAPRYTSSAATTSATTAPDCAP